MNSRARWGVALAALLAAQAARAAEVDAAAPAFPDRWGAFVEADFPFFGSVLDARSLGLGLPTNNLTPRGLILNLGNDCWACFDTELLRVSAVWQGGGVSAVSMAQISYHASNAKADAGQESLPRPLGAPWIATPACQGWQTGTTPALTDPRPPGPDPREVGRGPLPADVGRFKGLRLTGRGVRLEYEVYGAAVSEGIESRLEGRIAAVQRRLRLAAHDRPLTMLVGRTPGEPKGRWDAALASTPPGAAELVHGSDGQIFVKLHPAHDPVEFSVVIGPATHNHAWTPEGDGPATTRWPQTVPTADSTATARAAYVVDDIALPAENPWRRNVRLADIAFLPDGRAAAVTFDGDVWTISGLADARPAGIQWHRFASGFHEPLGLCVRDNDWFVFDRNGIWRITDTDANGEADVYELFSNAFTQTSETREFATGIRPAPDGSFVIGKGGIQMTTLGRDNGAILRVAPDGRASTVLGSGLREPFFGVHPVTGLVTASDQQGHYVPATPLHIVRNGQFYGFLSSLLPKERYPASIADPLTWIPYAVNPSGAGQVWLEGARMGPLNGRLIHLGYHRPELFVALLDRKTPPRQGAVYSLTRDLTFSPLHGAVNPADGQLYVAGFQIFGATAPRLSGLARLRFTGDPSPTLSEARPTDRGVLLRFDAPLPAGAADPANFSADRWNYKRTSDYGSPHFKPDGSKGMEPMRPTGATVSRDGRSVFVSFHDMKPAMQMRLGWSLGTRDGATFSQNAYFTSYELDPFDAAAGGFGVLVETAPPQSADTRVEPASAVDGQRIAERMGCTLCHSSDGATMAKVGPTWKGLFGTTVPLAGGGVANADEAYLRESIREPGAKIVRGYERGDVAMPSYDGLLSETQIESLVLYIKNLR